MTGPKLTALLLPSGTNFISDAGTLLYYPERYRRLLRKLLYFNFTRLDISHAVNNLSQFVGKHCELHYKGALHVLRYLKGTIHHGLYYSTSFGSNVIAYTNSDWAKCKDSQKSVSGYYIFLGCNLSSWNSKKQVVLSQCSTEVDTITWKRYFVKLCGSPIFSLIFIFLLHCLILFGATIKQLFTLLLIPFSIREPSILRLISILFLTTKKYWVSLNHVFVHHMFNQQTSLLSHWDFPLFLPSYASCTYSLIQLQGGCCHKYMSIKTIFVQGQMMISPTWTTIGFCNTIIRMVCIYLLLLLNVTY